MFTDGCYRRLSKWLSTVAVRAGVWREEEQVAGELSFGQLVFSMFVQQVISRATGLPSLCSFKGQYAPWSPDPRINDENTSLHNSESTQCEDCSNEESTDLQNCGVEGRLCCPRSPTSTQRGDVLPEQPSWSRALHCCFQRGDLRPDGGTPGLLRWDVFTQWRAAASQTANRAFYHKAQTQLGESAKLSLAV